MSCLIRHSPTALRQLQPFVCESVYGVCLGSTGDIAPDNYWWPGPASGHYGSDQLSLQVAIANPESLIVMSVRPAVLALSAVLTTRPFK